jgi:hypothetical protein
MSYPPGSLTAAADGARGYPGRPASDAELDAKFLACASRSLPGDRARDALAAVRGIARAADTGSALQPLR